MFTKIYCDLLCDPVFNPLPKNYLIQTEPPCSLSPTEPTGSQPNPALCAKPPPPPPPLPTRRHKKDQVVFPSVVNF